MCEDSYNQQQHRHSISNGTNSNTVLSSPSPANGNGQSALVTSSPVHSSINSSNPHGSNSISGTSTTPIVKNVIGKRNSIDVTNISPTSETAQAGKENLSRENSLNGDRDGDNPLHHRRSLSENVIVFPPHTTPSDKARYHMYQRTGSKLAESVIPESPTYSNQTLRKVAETMLLKDPQYKLRAKTDQGGLPKANPFSALSQLKGVKKILGPNPAVTTYSSGDLFSSCFEISAPLLREWNIVQNRNAKNRDGLSSGGSSIEGQPKSLPSSPTSPRKEYCDEEEEDSVTMKAKGPVSVLLNISYVFGFPIFIKYLLNQNGWQLHRTVIRKTVVPECRLYLNNSLIFSVTFVATRVSNTFENILSFSVTSVVDSCDKFLA